MLLSALTVLSVQSQVPKTLTLENFDQIKAYASPRENDLSWQRIDWHNTVAKGVNKAREVDKPIVMWLYFGDPRGSC